MTDDGEWKVDEGDWKDYNHNGKGVMKFSDGSVYEGVWKDDEIDGPVILTEVNGVMSKHVYDQGSLVSSKRCISSIYIASISPSPPHPSTDAVGVIPLIEQDIECQFCFNEFFTNMDTKDATAKMRLPVIGLCGHVCCYVLVQQTAHPEANLLGCQHVSIAGYARRLVHSTQMSMRLIAVLLIGSAAPFQL